MENQNKQTIKSYRYMWLFEGNENLNIKVITGLDVEHDDFIKALQDDDRVVNACRVYLHEIDINLIEFYDSIKKKEDKKE